jgi:hypothetical protein
VTSALPGIAAEENDIFNFASIFVEGPCNAGLSLNKRTQFFASCALRQRWVMPPVFKKKRGEEKNA